MNEGVGVTNNKTSKAKKAKVQPSIVNEIFDECAKVTTDPFWVERFNKAAVGKFSRGFSYRNGYLIYKKPTRELKLCVPLNPYEAVSACIAFFAKAGIVSPYDQDMQQERMKESLLEMKKAQTANWAIISRRKKIRNSLLATFMERQAKKYNLTTLEFRQLNEIINTGFILGFFGSKNIMVDNCNISEIKGLIFDNKTRRFSLDPAYRNKSTRNKKVTQTDDSNADENVNYSVNFYSLWNKYLDNIEKRMVNNNSIATESSFTVLNTPEKSLDKESEPQSAIITSTP